MTTRLNRSIVVLNRNNNINMRSKSKKFRRTMKDILMMESILQNQMLMYAMRLLEASESQETGMKHSLQLQKK